MMVQVLHALAKCWQVISVLFLLLIAVNDPYFLFDFKLWLHFILTETLYK